MLCIGSSLEVYPVAQLPETTLAAGGQIAILTQGPTPFDRRAAVRMGGDVVDGARGACSAALGLAIDASVDAGSRKRRRPRPERGLDPSERERDRLALGRAERPGERRLRGRGDAVAQVAQLLEALGQRRRRRVVRQLGERGVERDQHLQRGLARRGPRRGRAGRGAPAPRTPAARSRPVEQRGQTGLGGGDPPRRCRRGPASISSRASVHSPSATSSPAP